MVCRYVAELLLDVSNRIELQRNITRDGGKRVNGLCGGWMFLHLIIGIFLDDVDLHPMTTVG